MSTPYIQLVAGNFGASEPVNGSWIQAIYEVTKDGISGATGAAGTSGSSGTSGTSGGGGGGFTQSFNGFGDLVYDFNPGFSGTKYTLNLSGGLFTTLPSSGRSVVNTARHCSTIILRDGETLKYIETRVLNFVSGGVIDAALYSVGKRDVNGRLNLYATYSVMEAAEKVLDLGTFSVTGNAMYVLSDINYVGNKNETYNNLYMIVFRIDGGNYQMATLPSSDFIPHIFGGGLSTTGTYYRSYIQYVGTGGDNPSSLAGVVPTFDTNPGFVFYYNKQIP